MNKEELDRLLAAGEITQEEYDAKLAELQAGDGKGDEKTQQQQFEEFAQSDFFKQLLQQQAQQEADRVRTEYTKKLKAAESENAALKAAQMTEEERAHAALETERKALAEEREELQRVKMDAHATNVIIEKKLSMNLKKFIIGENEQDTINRADELSKEISTTVESEVERRVADEFKKHNYTPGGGMKQSGKANPFAKETFNMTEQAKLFRENPEEARRLAAAAGHKF